MTALDIRTEREGETHSHYQKVNQSLSGGYWDTERRPDDEISPVTV